MSNKTSKNILKSALKKNSANKTRKNVVIDTDKNEETRFTPDWKKEENEKAEQAERVRKNAERTSPPSDSEDVIYIKPSETKTHISVPKLASPPRARPDNPGPIRRAVRSFFRLLGRGGGSKRSRKNKKLKSK